MSPINKSNDYRHLGGLVRLYDNYESYGMKLFVFLICKYSVAIIVGLEAFHQLKWIECYLPGGGIVSPRVPETSKILVGVSWIYFASNKFLRRLLGREFNMFCIEVVYFNHEQLVSILATGRVPEQASPQDSGRRRVGDHPVIRQWFVSQLDPMQVVPRPIRSAKMRTIIAYLHLMSLCLLVAIMLAFACGYVIMMGPLLLTRRGFEISRKNCVQYIMEQSAADPSNESIKTRYDYIYRPEPNKSIEEILAEPIPVVLPYVDLVPLNLYHILRALTSGFEQLLLIINFGASYWYYLYFTIGFSMQLFAYGRDLLRRLEKLAKELSLSQAHQTDHANTSLRALARRDCLPEQGSDIETIQASLLDYFNLVAYYNPFISLSLLINLMVWFFYTFLFFARTLRVTKLRTFRVVDQGAEVELLTMFIGNLIMLAPFLICSSVLNSEVSKIYHAISTVMARDQSQSVRRLRWTKFLRFFQPRKLHCYTLANYAELSWLFCFKVSEPNDDLKDANLLPMSLQY